MFKPESMFKKDLELKMRYNQWMGIASIVIFIVVLLASVYSLIK